MAHAKNRWIVGGATSCLARGVLSGVFRSATAFAVCFASECLHALRRKILNEICVTARINKFAL
ncbi:hypothetical protein [uncultured Campylobacter sp.]|uniref:hypothetical protein n=1 Tax=uncultured Campylobacter sp. TaxID=218934 RepID=UPI0026090F31|nr:hypothetical protein [uncultured Campylobacter sp.]